MEQLSHSVAHVSIPEGVTSSAIASLGTGLGALPILLTSQLSDRWRTLLLSVGSGIMLAAAAFSLLFPALALQHQVNSTVMGFGVVAIALIMGGLLPYGLDKLVPTPDVERGAAVDLQGRRLGLFVMAIALHHFPEGIAVGLGTTSTQDVGIAVGVALQNLPEGLMVALALRELGYGIGLALAMATISGWLEPLGGAVGVLLAGGGTAIAPVGMAIAAGAMLFVVLHELFPELELKRLNSPGTLGLATGLVVMTMVEKLV